MTHFIAKITARTAGTLFTLSTAFVAVLGLAGCTDDPNEGTSATETDATGNPTTGDPTGNPTGSPTGDPSGPTESTMTVGTTASTGETDTASTGPTTTAGETDTATTGPAEPFCGDGNVDDNEECDDGDDDNNDGCTDQCVVAKCGEGYLDGCEGGCVPDWYIGDGDCDSNAFCGENQFDGGDCLADCDGEPLSCDHFSDLALGGDLGRCADGGSEPVKFSQAQGLLYQYVVPARFADPYDLCIFVSGPSDQRDACEELKAADIELDVCMVGSLLGVIPGKDAKPIAFSYGTVSPGNITLGQTNQPAGDVGLLGVDAAHPVNKIDFIAGKGDCAPGLETAHLEHPFQLLGIGLDGVVADYLDVSDGKVSLPLKGAPLEVNLPTTPIMAKVAQVPDAVGCVALVDTNEYEWRGWEEYNPDMTAQ